MKPEEKAAIKAAGITALITGAIALTIPNPAAWAAVIYGSYRMGKGAYLSAKERDSLDRQRENHYL